MVLGIGLDVASIARFEGVLDRHGARFVDRVLTLAERQVFAQRQDKATVLAGRWAAKEAAKQALYAGGGGATGYILGGKEGAAIGLGLSTRGGRRAGAYAALNAYKAIKSPVIGQALSGKLGAAAAASMAAAQQSGDPSKVGVAVQKAQVTDQKAREPEED